MSKQFNNPFILALKARNLSVEIHHHAAYQLVFSDDLPVESTLDGRRYPSIHGFLIKPQVVHHCFSEQGTVSIFNIEPYSAIGLKLAEYFDKEQRQIIFYRPEELSDLLRIDPRGFDSQSVVNRLLSMAPATTYDERVQTIAEYIHENYHETGISPQTCADKVFLSPSRLGALFKEQMGSSVSKYLLWTRLRQAIYRALTDAEANLTTIAHDAGFYDLSQMNKYTYEMFGMPPSAVKDNSDLIQVY